MSVPDVHSLSYAVGCATYLIARMELHLLQMVGQQHLSPSLCQALPRQLPVLPFQSHWLGSCLRQLVAIFFQRSGIKVTAGMDVRFIVHQPLA
jgi:hypothetical protein